jgi:esterase/lipase
MGGIVALGHLARYQNTGIGRLVTVGSQVTMPNGQIMGQFLLEMMKEREKQLTGKSDIREMKAQAERAANNMFFNERNVSPKVYEALTTWANEVPGIPLMQQYSVLAMNGELWDARREFNYARGMQNVQVPILITCGEADQLAPPSVQKHLYDNVGSRQKHLVIFGRGIGMQVNCGHNDSFVGLNSQQQVYPILERWLRTGQP